MDKLKQRERSSSIIYDISSRDNTLYSSNSYNDHPYHNNHYDNPFNNISRQPIAADANAADEDNANDIKRDEKSAEE